MYTGKEIDPITGLYYFNARWYDPELSRFITEDPVKDGNNWYVYCRNNPLMFTDPTGLMTQAEYEEKKDMVEAKGGNVEEFEEEYSGDIEDTYGNPTTPMGTGGGSTSGGGGQGGGTTTPTPEEIEEAALQELLNSFLNIFGLEPQEDSTFKVGLGIGGFIVVGGGIEVGLAVDSSGDLSPYLNLSVGVGVGVTTRFTAGLSTDKNTTVRSLDDSVSTSTSVGFGPMVTYDNDSRFSGAGGIGAGGAVTRSMTFTRHSVTQTVQGIKDMVDTVRESSDSYLDNYRNVIR